MGFAASTQRKISERNRPEGCCTGELGSRTVHCARAPGGSEPKSSAARRAVTIWGDKLVVGTIFCQFSVRTDLCSARGDRFGNHNGRRNGAEIVFGGKITGAIAHWRFRVSKSAVRRARC